MSHAFHPNMEETEEERACVSVLCLCLCPSVYQCLSVGVRCLSIFLSVCEYMRHLIVCVFVYLCMSVHIYVCCVCVVIIILLLLLLLLLMLINVVDVFDSLFCIDAFCRCVCVVGVDQALAFEIELCDWVPPTIAEKLPQARSGKQRAFTRLPRREQRDGEACPDSAAAAPSPQIPHPPRSFSACAVLCIETLPHVSIFLHAYLSRMRPVCRQCPSVYCVQHHNAMHFSDTLLA